MATKANTLSFRGNKYSNRKNELKFTISGSQADFAKLVDGDKTAASAFNAAVTAGLEATGKKSKE